MMAIGTKARMLASHRRVDKYNHEVEVIKSYLDSIQTGILEVKFYIIFWNGWRSVEKMLICIINTVKISH
ncbi:MAG: hypothetical protein ACMUJM_11490 [bacterium]